MRQRGSQSRFSTRVYDLQCCHSPERGLVVRPSLTLMLVLLLDEDHKASALTYWLHGRPSRGSRHDVATRFSKRDSASWVD
jgi:hypothetical protein